VNRYRLHMSGVSYAAMGYALDEHGTLPARLVDEHKLVHDLASEINAEREKKEQEAINRAYRKAGRGK
jgi:hypothetical protein